MTRTIQFTAWGDTAVDAVAQCVAESHLPDAPILLVADSAPRELEFARPISVIEHNFRLPGKQRKLEAFELVPRDAGIVLYLDADTRVLGDISLGFDRAKRYGMALAQAPHYALDEFRGFDEVMRAAGVEPQGQVVYNSGVVFWDSARDDVRQVFALARELASRHPGWSDQPFLSLAMEIAGFNPYALSPGFNHRAFGELISGPIRIWHSPKPLPAGASDPDSGYLRRVEHGRIERVMKVPTRPQPQIVLHIGAPKTGSTYLQRRLRADVQRLRSQGIYYPILPAVEKMAGNAKLLVTALDPEPTTLFRRVFPHIDHSTLDAERIAGELLDDWRRDQETIVLSAETFRPQHTAALRDLLPGDADYRVVLYVRRQDTWAESYYNQKVKTFQWHDPLTTFVAHGFTEFCEPDWYAHYSAWQSTFGSCEVVLYEEARPDLFASFFSAARLPAPAGIPEIEPVQVSVDVHTLLYLLEQPSSATLPELARARAASERAAARLGVPSNVSLLSQHDETMLRERYTDSNRRLMETLGREYAGSPLEFRDDPAIVRRTVDELRASSSYTQHRELADALRRPATG